MSLYRVGDDGATVFDTGGRPIRRLLPGEIVVDGTPADAAARYAAQLEAGKRRSGYADKRREVERDYDDKHAPSEAEGGAV